MLSPGKRSWLRLLGTIKIKAPAKIETEKELYVINGSDYKSFDIQTSYLKLIKGFEVKALISITYLLLITIKTM